MPDSPHRVVRPSRLPLVRNGLAAGAAAYAVYDLCRRRDPLRGPALSLGLAGGASATLDEMIRRPSLTFRRGLKGTTTSAVDVPPGGLWRVTVLNAGERTARIIDAMYHARRKGETETLESTEAAEIHKVMEQEGFDGPRDFEMSRLRPDAGLAPGEPLELFELPLPLARRFDALGVTLTYPSAWGEVLSLEVEVRPPHGFPEDAT
jgi:hypothetical protein